MFVKHVRPQVELLENRVTPALRLSLFSPGILHITGTLANPSASLVVRQTQQNVWTVIEDVDPFTAGGTTTLGSFQAMTELRVNPSRFFDNVFVDLNNFSYAGNITLNTGTGGTAPAPGPRVVAIFDGDPNGAVGVVRGNVLMLGGSGNEIYSIGLPQGTVANQPVIDLRAEVYGNVTVAPTEPRGVPPYDTFFVGPNSTIRGDLTVSNVEFPTIGIFGAGPARVLGSVGISHANQTKFVNVNLFGTFGKTVSVNSYGLAQSSFVLNGAGADTTLVRGGVSVTLGSAADIVDIRQGATVNGSFSANTGFGDDLFFIDGTVNGALTADMGDGNNTFAYAATAFVGGAMRLTAGNGTNLVGINGQVGGQLSTSFGNGTNDIDLNAGALLGGGVLFCLGHGDNTVDLANGAFMGGSFGLRTGNGNNAVNLDASGNALVTDIIFGNGDDSLTFTNGLFSGSADGGGEVTADLFTLGAGASVTPEFVLVNFP
jgi:hypothetical protein